MSFSFSCLSSPLLPFALVEVAHRRETWFSASVADSGHIGWSKAGSLSRLGRYGTIQTARLGRQKDPFPLLQPSTALAGGTTAQLGDHAERIRGREYQP